MGHSLIKGLGDVFRVVAFDYEGQCLRLPKPDTLTPANAVSDLLAVADAAGADRFAYYGYSWLALIGLQLAIRTNRLSALIMGGFPPLDGPYAAMLRVTMATHEMAVERLNGKGPPINSMNPRLVRQVIKWIRSGNSSPCTKRCKGSTTALPRRTSPARASALQGRRTKSSTSKVGRCVGQLRGSNRQGQASSKISAGRCECSMGWITYRLCRRSRWCQSCVRGWRPSFGYSLFSMQRIPPPRKRCLDSCAVPYGGQGR